MQQQFLPYYTYILRFWEEQESDKGDSAWRFTIEDPAQGTRHGFSSMDDLVAFLHAQVAQRQSRPGKE